MTLSADSNTLRSSEIDSRHVKRGESGSTCTSSEEQTHHQCRGAFRVKCLQKETTVLLVLVLGQQQCSLQQTFLSATWSHRPNRYICWFTACHTTVGAQRFHEKVSTLMLSIFFIKLLSDKSHFTTLPINTQPFIPTRGTFLWDTPKWPQALVMFTMVEKKCFVWLQNSPWRNYCYKNWDD